MMRLHHCCTYILGVFFNTAVNLLCLRGYNLLSVNRKDTDFYTLCQKGYMPVPQYTSTESYLLQSLEKFISLCLTEDKTSLSYIDDFSELHTVASTEVWSIMGNLFKLGLGWWNRKSLRPGVMRIENLGNQYLASVWWVPPSTVNHLYLMCKPDLQGENKIRRRGSTHEGNWRKEGAVGELRGSGWGMEGTPWLPYRVYA